jgi:Helix-turn-helix domain
MARFSDRMVTEVVQRFWAAMARGEFITDAAAEAGIYRKNGARWLVAAGGVRPRRGRDLKGRCLTFSEREEIALARAGGESMRAIARRLGRKPVDDQPRAGTQRWLLRAVLPRDDGARAGLRARRPAEAIEAGDQPGAAQAGRARSANALFTRADRRPVAPRIPCRSGDAGVERNHLPIPVRAVPRSAAPRPHAVSAHRTGTTPPVSAARAAQEPPPRHDQYRRAPRRG